MTKLSKVRLLRSALLVLVSSLLLSLVWTTLLGLRSGKVLFTDCGGGYCLRVAEGTRDHGIFSSEQRYEIWITREQSPDYGYVLHHSFAFAGFDEGATIRQCKVEWSRDGVSLVEPSGQRVFVPARLYQGGR